MLFCAVSLAATFFAFSKPTVTIYGDQISARTHSGRNMVISTYTEPRIVETLIHSETNVVEHIEGRAVTLKVDKVSQSLITASATVQDLLHEKNVNLHVHDEVSKGLDEALQENDIISIKRVRYRDYSEVVAIPYEIVHEKNTSVFNGLKVVWQPGEAGKKRKYYRERLEEGKMVSRNLLKEEMIIAPVKEIIAHGTLVFDGPYVKKIPMLASSYNPTVEQCGPNPFVTYSGLRVRYGIVATDPKVIPLGTWLYVSGYGYALAADIGGAIKGNRIDCFFWRSHVGSGWKGGHIYVYVLDYIP
jgi:3D (Asp-Asp-Asp) domain-containing protein